MSDSTIEQQVNRLWLSGEDDLITRLGINQQAIETAQVRNDAPQLARAQAYDAVFTAQDTEMGALDDIRAFGRRWWQHLEPRLHDLLCNEQNDQHEKLMRALGEGTRTLAVALAPAIVGQLALLPAAAIVVATIAAKKIYDSGLEAMCAAWSESLAGRAAAAVEAPAVPAVDGTLPTVSSDGMAGAQPPAGG